MSSFHSTFSSLEQNIPDEVQKSFGNKKPLFVVKGASPKSKTECMVYVILGMILITFALRTVLLLLPPDLKIEDSAQLIQFAKNLTQRDGVIVLLPFLSFFILALVGLHCVKFGLRHFFAPGEWYVGTDDDLRIIGKETHTIPWNFFNGKIRLLERGTALELEMITVKEVEDLVIPEVVKLRGLESAEQIENICRSKIKEAK